jgi:hypothetical protein
MAGLNAASDDEDMLKAVLTSSKLQKKKLGKDPFEYMGELPILLFMSSSG